MNRLLIILMVLCGAQLSAHPSTALVIDDRTNVYFAYWGGTWKFGGDGELTRIGLNDFHFMALDSMGRFANANIPFRRITAQGSQPSIFSFSDYPGTFHTDGDLYTAPWSIGRIKVERMNSGGGKTVIADFAIDCFGGKRSPLCFRRGLDLDGQFAGRSGADRREGGRAELPQGFAG